MRRLFKECVKMAIAMVLGLVYMWFALSFAWSFEDMSVAEIVAGVVYAMAMMPVYYGMKRALRLD